MKKLLSLVLSFSLIALSITPSMAGPVSGVGSALSAAERAIKTIYRLPAEATNMVPLAGASAVRVPVGSYSALQHAVEAAAATQSQLSFSTLAGLQTAQINQLSVTQAQNLVRDIILPREARSIESQIVLYLNALPYASVIRGGELTAAQQDTAYEMYRRSLQGAIANQGELAIINAKTLETWGQNMAAVSNIGLFGVQADAGLLLDTARYSPTIFNEYTDLIICRALLKLEAYEEISTLAARRAAQNHGVLTSQTWQEIARYAQQNGIELTLPTIQATTFTRVALWEKALGKWSELNKLYIDPSAATTAQWLSLKPGTLPSEVPAPNVATTSAKPAPTSREVPSEVIANSPETPAPATAAQTRMAPELATGSEVDPLDELLDETATAAAPASSTTGNMVLSTFVPVPPGILERVGNWMSNIGKTSGSTKAANKAAQIILNKPQPLATQLRDIVVGEASAGYKKQALLKLYNQGTFADFLKHQPKAVRNSVVNAKTDAERATALYTLYQSKYLDPVLANVSDVLEQGSLLRELETVFAQKDWAELAKSAYDAEAVLPLENANFDGAVSPVPEPDPKKIVGTVRPAGYAKDNMNPGTLTKKGIYRDTNIPFYYRNSKGVLSSEPVGILTQVPANFYGKLLSKLHLATQPGMTIPEGFVLALDEQGQWKFVVPKGNLAIAESNATSRKVLEAINKSGSARVILDTPYNTSELLAMAHLLEHNPNVNLELSLNTPHSLSQFLTAHALFVGNDAGNTLTGPFKESLKTIQGLANTMANLVSGVGYMTPIAGGYMMPTMSKWGNVKTTKVIYGAAAAALAYSVAGLGMYGTVDPASLPLAALAIPTVALVLGASLANSFIPTFLNFYKDPAARTAANLDFSTKKQISRLGLSGIIAGVAALGGNWTIVAPIGLGLLGISYGLFRNTPMFKEAQALSEAAAQQAAREKARFDALTPAEQEAERSAQAAKAAEEKRLYDQYVAAYKDFRKNLPEMKAIKSRVKMVYASYAASLMVLGQSANAAFGGGVGQGFITLCMLATLGTRLAATKLVKKNIMTDDQLTGLSLPTLALTGIALALLPYSGIAAAGVGIAGILHYMATAVPGQLDAARMQNIVTAEMQQRKQAVLDDPALTEVEKEAQVAQLTAQEKVWSAQASKDYSLYNARGLWGIGAATLGALVFADLGPQWTQDMLQWISDVYNVSNPSLSLNRLLFAYSATVASALALKNTDLTADGVRFVKNFARTKFLHQKPGITEAMISANTVQPESFGINANNAQIQLGDVTSKRMKEVEPLLIEYGLSSEQKMTKILQQLQAIHNRLVAIGDVLGETAVRAAFLREAGMVEKFGTIAAQNDLSVMLRREFANLQQALFEPGTNQVLAKPTYVEEGQYDLPTEYTSYESARRLVDELDQLAYSAASGKAIDYMTFVEYMSRARADLVIYETSNPADSIRVMQLRQKMDNVCRSLAQQDKQYGILNPEETDSQQIRRGKQALRDMLAGFHAQ